MKMFEMASWPWQWVGHIATGAVVKQHSAVAKSYAAATAIPLTVALNWLVFGKQPAPRIVLGSPVVCAAVVLYTTAPKRGAAAGESGGKPAPE